jgi:hypothetical protein
VLDEDHDAHTRKQQEPREWERRDFRPGRSQVRDVDQGQGQNHTASECSKSADNVCRRRPEVFIKQWWQHPYKGRYEYHEDTSGTQL